MLSAADNSPCKSIGLCENMVIKHLQQKIELPQLESSTFFQNFTSLKFTSVFILVRRGLSFIQLFWLACRQVSAEIVLFSICIFITKADQAIQQHENEKRLREKEDLSSLSQISPIFDPQEVAGKFEMDIKYYLP